MVRSPLARYVGLACLGAIAWVFPAQAQTELFRSGSLTWDTTTANWGTATGGPYDAATWNNATELRAVFEGTAGTATLGGAITAHSLRFDVTGWTVTGNTLTLFGTAAGTIDVPTAGNTATINSILAGSAGLTKTGAGTLALGATNTFTGPITVTGGAIRIGVSTALPTGNGAVTLDGGTLSNTNAGVGGTFLAGTHPVVIGSGGGTIDVPNSAAILIYTGGTVSPVTAGTGTITKTGAGTLRMTSVPNTVQKLVVTGGIWQSNTDTGFGAVPGSFLADAITLDGGGISVNAGIPLSANRGITLGAGGGTFQANSNFTGVGVISGVGGLTKTGANTLVLNTAATYTGGTTITVGTIQLSAGNDRLPTTGNVAFTGGTLDLNTRSQTINALSSTAAVGTITTVAAGTPTLTVGNGGGSGTYSGVIQNGGGTVAVTKVGTGTQALTGANTYTGPTTVNGGTLVVGGSLAAGSAVTVNSAGTLAGTGTVNGAVTVNGGGTIRGATGTDTTNLNFTNAVTINGAAGTGGGVLATQLTTSGGTISANSKLALTGATGNLNLDPTAGKFRLTLLGDGGLTSFQPYTITLATAAGPTNFQRAGSGTDPFTTADFDVVSGSGVWSSFQDVILVRANTTDLQLTFTPVPEPATVLAVAGLGLGLLRWRRRK